MVTRITRNIDLVLSAFVLIVILFVVGVPILSHVNDEIVNVKVSSKEVKNTREDSKYLIFTDKTTYEITDSLLMFRFDSSDVFGRIKENHCYELKVRGWRVPFLSMYQNIDTFTEVKCGIGD